MKVSENTRERGSRTVTAILFLSTLPQRLTLLGTFVFVVVTVTAPSYAQYAWIEITLLFLAAGAFAARDSIRRTRSTIGLERGVGATVGVVVIGVAVALATRFLATAGTFGLSASTDNHTERFRYLELDLVVVTLWLLLWIPQLFFHIQLDIDATGDAQRVLLGLIAVTASIVTGIYVLLLHFGGGPLQGISTGPLAAGVAGLVLLITPVYRSLARTCWNRGISDIVQFSKYRQDWGKTLIELRQAIDQASERGIARSSGAAAVEAAVPPPSERPAPRPAQGWPKWGLLAASGLVVSGICVAAVTAHSNSGASAAGFLMIVGFITALACAAVMILRGVVERGARGEVIGRASARGLVRSSGAAAVVEAAAPPPSERPAPGPAQGWPEWGLLAACGLVLSGTFIWVAVAGNSSAEAVGWLVILSLVTALACAVVMLLRRIKQRGARQHPAGAEATTPATAQHERASSVVLMLGALLGCGPWSAAIGALQVYGSRGYTIDGRGASTSTAHSLCQAGQATSQPGICGSIDDHYTFGVAVLVIGALAFAGGMIGLFIAQRRNPRAWRQSGSAIVAGLVFGIFAVAEMIIVAIVRSIREGTAGSSH